MVSGMLSGKRGLVMGVANDHSIAWGIAKALHAHGAAVGFSSLDMLLERRVPARQAGTGRRFLVAGPDYPDVAALQRQMEELSARRGPLTANELAEARRQLTDCWAHASESLGMANRSIDLSLVLNRDGSVR